MDAFVRVEFAARYLDDGHRFGVNAPAHRMFLTADDAWDLDNTYEIRADHIQIGTLLVHDGKACYVCWVNRRLYQPGRTPRNI